MTVIKPITCINYFVELIIQGGNRKMVKLVPKKYFENGLIGILKTRIVRIIFLG